MLKRQKQYRRLEIIYIVWVIFTAVFVGVSVLMFAAGAANPLLPKLLFAAFTVLDVCALVCFYKFSLKRKGYMAHYLPPHVYTYRSISYDQVKAYLMQKPYKGSLTVDKPSIYRSTLFHKRKQGKLYCLTIFEIGEFEQKSVKSMRESVRRKQKQYIDANNLDYESWYVRSWRRPIAIPNYHLHLFITQREMDYANQLMKLNGTSNGMRGILQAVYCAQSGTLYIPACFGDSTGKYTSLHKDMLHIFNELNKTPAN